MPHARIIFITGTDTGVGKTVLTALLLSHLHSRGHNALAIKPFCSGSQADPALLRSLQGRALSLEEVNPFHFSEPVSPLAAARRLRRRITLPQVLSRIEPLARRGDWLLIEGVGGLMVPLGEGFSVLDLIVRLRPQVLVASRNRLGTLNHTLLTVNALRSAGINNLKVVLMEPGRRDRSSKSNALVLSELLDPVPLFSIQFLGRSANRAPVISKSAIALSATLEQLLVAA